MQFNKQLFITRLDFFLQHWYATGTCYTQIAGEDKLQALYNIGFTKCMEVLWQNRYQGAHFVGIDSRDAYDSFCRLLTVGINQLQQKLVLLWENKNVMERATQAYPTINAHVCDLADDVEDLLKVLNKHQYTIKKPNENGAS